MDDVNMDGVSADTEAGYIGQGVGDAGRRACGGKV